MVFRDAHISVGVVSAVRRREVAQFLSDASTWAAARGDLVAAAVVGSWAQGEPREDSDVDLVLLADDPTPYTEHDDWVAELAPGATLIGTADWGAITERRLLILSSGLEIEVGVGRPSWASTDPLDGGTRRVVADGLRPLYDPRGILEQLRRALLGD